MGNQLDHGICEEPMIAILAALTAAPALSPSQPHPVIELRQYKIVHGQRDRFIALFDKEFLETQEAEGMTVVGQFRDRADPDRFTWIRAFPNMDARQKSLTAFYTGATWLAHRGTANPLLFDNDNVLLLRPAWFGSEFSVKAARPAPGDKSSGRLQLISIHYLWKQPDEGFTAFFKGKMMPVLARAGIPVEAALVREESLNNFPRLPVREGEKLFVWAASVGSESAWKSALARLARDPEWPSVEAGLSDYEERPVQRLMLEPTPHSKLR
jgi:quinol monooxygenase YgiN